MSVRDLIAAAFNKDAASFEDTLNAVMQEKMAAAVQARFSPAVYEEEVDLSEAKGLHDYDWPKSGMDRDATLGDHAHDAIHHGMHARDAIDHIYSAADDHGKKWVNKHHDDLLKTFKSHGLKSESQFDEEDWDEEDELEEALRIGSKVKIHAPGKDYHGKIGHVGEIRKRTYGTMAPSYTVDYREPGEDYNRSVSLSREKIKLHKEEVDQIDELSKKTLGSYVRRASVDAYRRGQDVEAHTNARDASDNYAAKRRHAELTDKARLKASNRITGIEKATHKMTKEEVDQIDEISGAKLGTYLIKARKSEAELDKKRDDSYDKPNTPENKAERKAISRTLNKRRWGHGKALDKLTGSSFAKVHATEK
jgi:ribosomal protein L21E